MNLTPSTVATVSPLTNLGPFGVWITWPCTNSRSASSPPPASERMNWPAWKTARLAFPLPPEAAPEGTTMPGMNWNLPFSPLIENKQSGMHSA